MKEVKYIVGIDLHGTLLEPGEKLRDELVPNLILGLQNIQDRAELFLCTGNDLGFVDRKVPPILRECFSGYVLETGCSVSDDHITERVVTTEAETAMIKDLEQKLKDQSFEEVNYFAHRLTSISLFCDEPLKFFTKVSDCVNSLGFTQKVHVTYSSVAVDILPAGYNKHKGLKAVARGKKTIGIADSMNDAPLLIEADHALAPSNIPSEVQSLLIERGLKVGPLREANELSGDTVLVAGSSETLGVIEILGFLDRVL